MTILERQLEASIRSLAVVPKGELAKTDGALRFTSEQEAMIRDSYANGATEEEFAVLLEIAKVRRLNPLLRQIHFVKRWDKDKNRYVWSAQVSIDGLRAVAERTGLYNGQDEPEYGPKNAQGFPEFAKVRVYRKGWDRPVVGVAYWAEFVQVNQYGKPTKFWANMPYNQLAKCAESLALRKAFPEDCGGLYTDSEMEQADNEPPILRRYEPARGHDPANDTVDRRPITAHGSDEDDSRPPPESAEEFESLLEELQTIENSIPGCVDYDGALVLRDMLGSAAKPSPLLRRIQAAKEAGQLSPSMHATLSRAWQRCNRQIAKLERDLAPGPLDSFRDE